jgi:hypothetical protein
MALVAAWPIAFDEAKAGVPEREAKGAFRAAGDAAEMKKPRGVLRSGPPQAGSHRCVDQQR